MPSTPSVLIVAEVGADGLRPVSLELVTAARRLAGSGVVTALLVGRGTDGEQALMASTGVNRVLVADDSRLEHLTAETAASVVAQAIRAVQPAVVLFGNTTLSGEYAPRVAARLRVGLVSDCIELAMDGDALTAVRPALGGRVQASVSLDGARTQLASVRQGVFAKAATVGAAVAREPFPVQLSDADLRSRVVSVAPKTAAEGVGLETAEVVVAGGRGLKDAAQFGIVERLAAALGGAVGATRAVTDAGWRPHHEQIGQTGRVVSPRLYVAVGISGAAQHLVGMQGSDAIVAINRDPDAPIFKLASFGIVGDLFEIVPAIVAELDRAKATS